MTYRNNLEVVNDTHINFVLNHCALGDGISSLPAICWARRNHTRDMTMTVWAPQHVLPLFEHLIGMDGLTFQPLADFQRVLKKGSAKYAGAAVMNSVEKNTTTRNRIDMVVYAFLTLLDRQPDFIAEMNYPTWAPLGPRVIPEPYVVLPVGATNDTCVFHAKVMQPIIEWLQARGYKVVLTGNHNNHVYTTDPKPVLLVVRDQVAELPKELVAQCIDTRNTLDLMQLRDLCGHAQAVVGVDGGTLHLAGTTNVPIVYGMTRVGARHRGIVRHDQMNWQVNHVEPKDLECAGCQSNWTLIFRHNFANCVYGDNACVTALDPQDFIQALHDFGL